MKPLVGISAVIPTTCETSRREQLWRAIHSVLGQQDVDIELIIVVNGTRYDTKFLSEIKSNPALRVHFQPEASLPAALRTGRSLVTKDFFCFLDDDDEYLPGALAARLAPLLLDKQLDAVATNGYSTSSGRELRVRNGNAVNIDPLAALVNENWLASCGGLFRSATISLDFFDGQTSYFEWTLIAFRIALAKRKVAFLDVPTYLIHDTPDSLSKTKEYHEALSGFIKFLLTFDCPPPVRKGLKRKLSAALHNLSNNYRQSGDLAKAWRFHIESLTKRGGFQYLAYTRKLLFSFRF